MGGVLSHSLENGGEWFDNLDMASVFPTDDSWPYDQKVTKRKYTAREICIAAGLPLPRPLLHPTEVLPPSRRPSIVGSSLDAGQSITGIDSSGSTRSSFVGNRGMATGNCFHAVGNGVLDAQGDDYFLDIEESMLPTVYFGQTYGSRIGWNNTLHLPPPPSPLITTFSYPSSYYPPQQPNVNFPIQYPVDPVYNIDPNYLYSTNGIPPRMSANGIVYSTSSGEPTNTIPSIVHAWDASPVTDMTPTSLGSELLPITSNFVLPPASLIPSKSLNTPSSSLIEGISSNTVVISDHNLSLSKQESLYGESLLPGNIHLHDNLSRQVIQTTITPSPKPMMSVSPVISNVPTTLLRDSDMTTENGMLTPPLKYSNDVAFQSDRLPRVDISRSYHVTLLYSHPTSTIATPESKMRHGGQYMDNSLYPQRGTVFSSSVPSQRKCKPGGDAQLFVLSESFSHMLSSLPPCKSEPPLYILMSSLSAQFLWYRTAGKRPRQSQRDRAQYERLWRNNFINSNIKNEDASYDEESLPSTGVAIDNYSTIHNSDDDELVPEELLQEMIPVDNLPGELLFAGTSPFSNAVTKSFFSSADEGSVSVSLRMPHFRVCRGSGGAYFAEFLVVLTVGGFSFGIWKRKEEFEWLRDLLLLANCVVVEAARRMRTPWQHYSAEVSESEVSALFSIGDWGNWSTVITSSFATTLCSAAASKLLPSPPKDVGIYKHALRSFQALSRRFRGCMGGSFDDQYLALQTYLLERFLQDILFETHSPRIITQFLGLDE